MTVLVDPKTQARWFKKLREAHQTETTEDYVELIADLIAAQGEARLVDIAARLGIAHATANKVLLRLRKEGYVDSQPYRSVFLTDKGADLARSCKTRHEVSCRVLAQTRGEYAKPPKPMPKESNITSVPKHWKFSGAL